MVANDILQARAIGSFAATQLGANRYAALDDGTPYGKGLADGAAAQLKAEKKEVVVRKSFDDKTVAFDELAGELKAANVEVIVSTLNDFQALALLESLKKVGHTKVSLLGGDTIKTTDMTKGAGIVQGLYATSPVLEAKEFTTGKTFLEKYIAAFKKPRPMAATTAMTAPTCSRPPSRKPSPPTPRTSPRPCTASTATPR